jgi:hypothetical protein
MSDADKELVRSAAEKDRIGLHFGWAMDIRHRFGLWQGNTQLLAACGEPHPDDASMAIVRAVWERLREQRHAEPGDAADGRGM